MSCSAELFEATIVEIRPLSATVREVWLQPAAASSFIPGQYLLLRASDPSHGELEGAFSLCQPPRVDGRLAICVRRGEPDDCATALFAHAVGDSVRCGGPRGSLVLAQPVVTDLVLIATGTGIAPFHAMLEQLRALAGEYQVWLLQGARQRAELFYEHDWRALAAAESRFQYLPILSQPRAEDGWTGPVGRVSQLIDTPPSALWPVARVYLCGQADMVQQLAVELPQRGADPRAICREQ